MAGWVDGGGDRDGVRQLLCHQGHAAHHRLQVQGGEAILTNQNKMKTSPFCKKVLSVLYQYENLTEDLEEEVKTGEKKRRAGGDSKVVVNVICGKLHGTHQLSQTWLNLLMIFFS